MEYYFKADELCVGYQRQPLIKNITINLPKGEILTLIGPNGAGKSTVLKSIARQLRMISGTVFIDRQNLEKMSSVQLSQKMAVVLTDRIKTEMMTCEDVVATGRYPYTGRFGILSHEDFRIVHEAMEAVHIEAMKDKDFLQMSDGQKQRAMLARAICQEPEIIILDEPTSFLDIKYKLEFLSILQEMCRKKGLTVILSLHELELAARISDKILCINGEYVERFGTPEEIFTDRHITELFGITMGSFNEGNTSVELEAAKGYPELFVIAGNGSGRAVYRRLQRKGIAFMTGILFQNDLDYPTAKALAAEVVETESFEPIAESVLETAKQRLCSCKKAICCRKHFGSFEVANKTLFEYARDRGLLLEEY